MPVYAAARIDGVAMPVSWAVAGNMIAAARTPMAVNEFRSFT
ncbi:MAG: hypothetical protein ABGY96_08370 [bacterium]